MPAGGRLPLPAGSLYDGLMKESTARSVPAFLAWATAAHVLTYFFAGLLASSLLDYRAALSQPVIRDYMVGFAAAPVFLGPLFQLLRGLVFGLVLLPLRGFLAGARRGWLHLWLLMVGLGIVSTPAAAPCSIEGVLYTRLPLWYHLFGLPEILLQTLAFSAFVHRAVRGPGGSAGTPSAVSAAALRALAGACFAFIGYAVFSVAFALAVGADISAEANLGLKTQGLFIAPFLLNTAILLARDLHAPARKVGRLAVFALVLLGNSAAILLYQALVLGGVSAVYALAAPLLPALIVSAAAFPRGKGSGPQG